MAQYIGPRIPGVRLQQRRTPSSRAEDEAERQRRFQREEAERRRRFEAGKLKYLSARQVEGEGRAERAGLAAGRQRGRYAMGTAALQTGRTVSLAGLERGLGDGEAAAPGLMPRRMTPRQERMQKLGIRVGTPHEMADVRAEARRGRAALAATELRLARRLRQRPAIIRHQATAETPERELVYGAARSPEQAREYGDFLAEAKGRQKELLRPEPPEEIQGLQYLRRAPALRGQEARALPTAPGLGGIPAPLTRGERGMPTREEEARTQAGAARAAYDPSLTETDWRDVHSRVSELGIAGQRRETSPEALGISPDMYRVAAAAVETRQPQMVPGATEPLTPEAAEQYLREHGAGAEGGRLGYVGGLRQPTRMDFGGQSMMVRSPYEGMPQERAQTLDLQRRASFMGGELERRGFPPEEIDQMLMEQFPGIGERPHTRWSQPGQEEQRLTEIGQRPIVSPEERARTAGGGGAVFGPRQPSAADRLATEQIAASREGRGQVAEQVTRAATEREMEGIPEDFGELPGGRSWLTGSMVTSEQFDATAGTVREVMRRANTSSDSAAFGRQFLRLHGAAIRKGIAEARQRLASPWWNKGPNNENARSTEAWIRLMEDLVSNMERMAQGADAATTQPSPAQMPARSPGATGSWRPPDNPIYPYMITGAGAR